VSVDEDGSQSVNTSDGLREINSSGGSQRIITSQESHRVDGSGVIINDPSRKISTSSGSQRIDTSGKSPKKKTGSKLQRINTVNEIPDQITSEYEAVDEQKKKRMSKNHTFEASSSVGITDDGDVSSIIINTYGIDLDAEK
jgi:hypothetical protein